MKLNLPKVKRVEVGNTHTYELDGNLLVGTTTVLQQKNKDFMAPWASKECANYLQENWDIKKRYTQKEKGDLLQLAKNAWRRKGDKAKDQGTIAHSFIEGYIKKKKQPMPDGLEAQNAIKAFLEWEKKAKPKWLKSEMLLASRKHLYAGTCDFLAIIDGKLVLGDFKTSKMISDEYNLQLAAYENCLREAGLTGELVRFILRLDKESGEYEEYFCPTPYEFDLEVFLALKTVHKWDVYNKNRK